MARDRALTQILKELSEIDPRAFMELSYIAIIQDPEYAISLRHEKKEKMNSIGELLRFFESEERYEECAELKKILNEINERG
jgi:hypothetical protein